MYRNLFLSITLLVISVLSGKAQEKSSNLQVGFIHPVSSNGKDAASYSNKISLNMLGGVSYAEEVVSFSGLFNKVKTNAKGAQVAGLTYLVGENSTGFLFSGLLNTYGSAKGAQITGLANLSKKNVQGLQFAGLLNTAEKLKGAQIGGLVNSLKDTLKGLQFAGIANTAKTVKGSQFAGIVNKAVKVSGVQFAGIVNIADSSDYPIAFLNFVKNGEKSIGFSIDEQGTTLATFRSGGRIMYGILGLGYNLKNEKEIYALQAGIGAHLLTRNKFKLNAEATNVILESFRKGSFYKNSLTLMPSYRIDKRLDIFIGASLNYLSTNTKEGRELTKKFIHTWTENSNGDFQGVFAGAIAGLKLRL